METYEHSGQQLDIMHKIVLRHYLKKQACRLPGCVAGQGQGGAEGNGFMTPNDREREPGLECQ